MKELIANFSLHLKDAVDLINSFNFKASDRAIHNVVITGLGGSGIGGSAVLDLVNDQAIVPIHVNKDYDIPAFVGRHTLFIACSYSGNTEETLTAVAKAEEKGAIIACISSGGTLKAKASENGYNCLSMIGGNPPRSMFAYPFSFLLYYLRAYGIISEDPIDHLNAGIQLLERESDNIKREADRLAQALQNTTAQILACSGSIGVAARMRQQLNENAKMLCWEAEVPEMNHNELVGWEGGNDSFSCLMLRNESDNPRNAKRMDIIKTIIGAKTPHVYEVWSKGNSNIERALYLVHLGDWVSYYLSELNEVDIIDIKSIDLLKSELSKLPL
ncbi:MAG: bifunctional phosphoglucose/phosphomannose isomerase [Bacteroidetes bacterium]|nr:bifunctional phosphoglucose/phosphomannose isomerase [Bacteroidota bacterium]